MTLNESEDNLVANVLPVELQSSELVLQDDEGNSVVTELDELSSVSEQNIAPTAINIENSKDVVIGPVTQFHGPVTIYQNVNGNSAIQNTPRTPVKECYQNGKLVKSESSSSDASHVPDKPTRNFIPYSKHFKYFGILVVIILVASVVACTIILTSKSRQIKTEEPLPSTDYTLKPSPSSANFTDRSGNNQNLQPILPGSFIDRALWHGLEPLNFTKPLAHPTPFVLISHTATPMCMTFLQCYKRMQSMQAYHMNDIGSPDIGYNFVIGGDGNIYVGRGWDIRNFHSANSIGISFVGNFVKDNLTEPMIKAAKKVIDKGVEMGKLSEDYKIICHNQTFATLSPGRHVYSVVKTWPHFDPTVYKKS